MLETTGAKLWAFWRRYDIESANFWKIRFLGQIPENGPWENQFRLRVASIYAFSSKTTHGLVRFRGFGGKLPVGKSISLGSGINWCKIKWKTYGFLTFGASGAAFGLPGKWPVAKSISHESGIHRSTINQKTCTFLCCGPTAAKRCETRLTFWAFWDVFGAPGE